ncbi:MAG: N-acetyl sugar amidotransferase [Sulfuricaulis sp.]|nr:N-acetyl sugar amidotransferase [Sulfuricaulis sp.]
MTRCTRCLIPDSRPDTEFVDGVCTACINHDARKTIDWNARKAELLYLRDRLEPTKAATGYHCIVPSSGGKDSTFQVITLLELGFRPLVVTATTCMLTPIGRRNIDNLARFATTIEVTPNRTVRAKLNRIGLEKVGDISWPEHMAIFTIPFKVASQTGIKALFYGENPQHQYGGPVGTENAKHLTRRWRSEFGGFLGLRPSDVIGMDGITADDMRDYEMPSHYEIEEKGIEAHFLGYYLPWDSDNNAAVAKASGMEQSLPCSANLWESENLDNAMTGIHDYMGFLKYGYGRACAQASVEIRNGSITRDQGLSLIKRRDGYFPSEYAGVSYSDGK